MIPHLILFFQILTHHLNGQDLRAMTTSAYDTTFNNDLHSATLTRAKYLCLAVMCEKPFFYLLAQTQKNSAKLEFEATCKLQTEIREPFGFTTGQVIKKNAIDIQK
jgi:hypothetical protein